MTSKIQLLMNYNCSCLYYLCKVIRRNLLGTYVLFAAQNICIHYDMRQLETIFKNHTNRIEYD